MTCITLPSGIAQWREWGIERTRSRGRAASRLVGFRGASVIE
jgi:hypothetical protein